MRIGIVTTWFDRGAAMVSRAYRDVLVQAGHEVFVYARGGERAARTDPSWDAPWVTWNRGSDRPATTVHWRQFRRWVKDRSLDLLFFNEQRYWPVVVFARREFGIPIGSYVDYYTSRTVPFFELFDFLVCNTQRHRGVFSWHPQAIYVPWGTDCGVFRGTYEPVLPGQIVFFHSAGMSPSRKGTEVALRAFRSLPGDPRFVLHIQAPLKDHPRLAELVQSDPRIEVVNETVGPPGLYHRGDVYVYPSLLEGIGLTVMEALASGLPVITTGSPPMTEFVSDGVNGWLVPPSEYRGRWDGYYWAEAHCRVEDVAAAMQKMPRQPEALTEWKRRARLFAQRNLDWSRNSANLPGDFLRICARGRPKRNLRALENEALDFEPHSFLARVARRIRKL